MMQVDPDRNEQPSDNIDQSCEARFSACLVRDVAVKGLSDPRSLELEEIMQLCIAVLAHINNHGALDI